MTESTIELPPSCDDEHQPGLLTVEQARERILDDIQPITGYERVGIRSGLGRVLGEDIISPIDVPSHTNSAMDGYALAAVDLPEEGERLVAVVGTSWAGRPFSGRLQRGQCVRIMTGGVVPAGADTVVMQEHVRHEGDDKIRVGGGHPLGDNVRAAGEDIAHGSTVLSLGKRLLPPELGLLASLGIGEITVRRRLRVAFFSTGDELRSIGERLEPGQIYDSNRYTLYGMLTRLGVEMIDMGVVRDRRDATRRAFLQAADQNDAIITSGGVSVGEADYVKETLDAVGEVKFWKIAMKPGRPLAYGRVRTARFFGLPGNPVSVMVTFYQFVQPALRRMMGETGPLFPLCFKVRCASPLRKRRGRTEFQRAILDRDERGELVVRSTGEQGSGILNSMSLANCLVILPADSTGVEPGAIVDVQPFTGFM